MLVDLRSFQYGSYRLAYETHGSGAITIVLLHGLLLDAHINRGLALALADAGYKVVLLDVLGHGRSDRPPDPTLHRFDHYARQVVARPARDLHRYARPLGQSAIGHAVAAG